VAKPSDGDFWAESSVVQRRRLTAAAGKKRALETRWLHEWENVGQGDGEEAQSTQARYRHQQDIELAILTDYPKLIPCKSYPTHHSIFAPPAKAAPKRIQQGFFTIAVDETPKFDVIHIDESSRYLAWTLQTQNYRLSERAASLAPFAQPKPAAVNFPEPPSPLAEKSLPAKIVREKTWRDWLDFGRQAKRDKEEIERRYQEELLAIKGYNNWAGELNSDQLRYWEHQKEEYEKSVVAALGRWQKASDHWDSAVERDRKQYLEFISGYEKGDSETIAEYFRENLTLMPQPEWLSPNFSVSVNSEQGFALIDMYLPNLSMMQVLKTRELKRENKLVNATKKERAEVEESLPYMLALRAAWEITQLDTHQVIGYVACNGHVISDDPATGHRRDDIVLSFSAPAEELKAVRLSHIQPKACFQSFRGVAGARLSELVPVPPVLIFDKKDARFVDGKDVIDSQQDTNLATMDWQNFEYLVRELFAAEFAGDGAEVRVTQASRDKGVDAIAFDPDPIKGGKFVIQAKRYNNTVDVSAVRDLYGTMMNEGASRGILVTTSAYGRDAHEFVKNKPISLLNGSQLLGLLEKHGYHYRIDLKSGQ
jgi:restriction system protein